LLAPIARFKLTPPPALPPSLPEAPFLPYRPVGGTAQQQQQYGTATLQSVCLSCKKKRKEKKRKEKERKGNGKEKEGRRSPFY